MKTQIIARNYLRIWFDDIFRKLKIYALRGAKYQQLLDFQKNKQSGPLSLEEVEKLTAFQIEKVTVGLARDYALKLKVTDEDMQASVENLHPQARGTRLLFEVLSKYENEIHSVANIGARIDTVLSFLAPRYPRKTFVSVDLQPNLREVNQVLPPSSNWSFITGYALSLLKEKKLSADLYFMTSTSVLFNNTELNAYITEFSRTGKFIVLNEPWWPQTDSVNIFRIQKPEEVPVEVPYCGGLYSNYHHNYIKKLEASGYRILLSKIIFGRKETHGVLQIVAAKSELQLGD